jgi:hypothetical protein
MAKREVVKMVIVVDVHGGMALEVTCEKCGAVEANKPVAFELFDRETGAADPEGVFRVRGTIPPHGWDRVLGPDGFHVDVCGDCLRAWLSGVRS